MAGIKITDLPALSVADSADYLCIVDVSDTSASPAGTTKKIEVANYGIGGQYTPAYTTSTGFNVDTFNAVYSIIGKVMNLGLFIEDCSIDFDVDTLATIDIELPTGYSAADTGGAVSPALLDLAAASDLELIIILFYNLFLNYLRINLLYI
jgi:hypothetical protein